MNEMAKAGACPTCHAPARTPCHGLDGHPRSNHTKRNDLVRDAYWQQVAERDADKAARFATRLEAEKSQHAEIRRLFHRAHLSGSQIRAKTGCVWQTIFEALEVNDYEGYKKALAARNSRRRQEIGWRSIRADILERDGRACVVTGEQQTLQVHHINGDSEDNRRENLVTLTRRVHAAIENPIPLGWWHRRPQDAESRLAIYWQFSRWLRSNGHPAAGVAPEGGTLWFRLEGGYMPGDRDDQAWNNWTSRRESYLAHKARQDKLMEAIDDDGIGGGIHEERYASFDPEHGALDMGPDAALHPRCPTCGAEGDAPCRNLAFEDDEIGRS